RPLAHRPHCGRCDPGASGRETAERWPLTVAPYDDHGGPAPLFFTAGTGVCHRSFFLNPILPILSTAGFLRLWRYTVTAICSSDRGEVPGASTTAARLTGLTAAAGAK